MGHWLELYDKELSLRETPLPARPRDALFMLFRDGGVRLRSGDAPIDLSKPVDHVETEWFHILYDAVRFWYKARFGAEAMRPRGSAPLEGVVTLHGTPFLLVVPTNRKEVEEEGKTAWIYFEDAVGDDEDAISWIDDRPALSTLTDQSRQLLAQEATEVAGTLRFVEYRQLAASINDDQEARKLVVSTSTYLQQAARRIVSGATRERGPAWFDLQMAAEAALKATLRHSTGDQPRTHNLPKLLASAREHGVVLDDAVFADWPVANDIIEWRYGQGDPWNLYWLLKAYRSALKVARAAMTVMPVGLKPGFGVLLEYPTWLREFD